jgi:hypothetical protein
MRDYTIVTKAFGYGFTEIVGRTRTAGALKPESNVLGARVCIAVNYYTQLVGIPCPTIKIMSSGL